MTILGPDPWIFHQKLWVFFAKSSLFFLPILVVLIRGNPALKVQLIQEIYFLVDRRSICLHVLFDA